MLESSAEGLRALWISLAGLAATALAQAAVVALSGSVALLGDALHNVADALTAVPLASRSGWPGPPPAATPMGTAVRRTWPACIVVADRAVRVLVAYAGDRPVVASAPVTHLGWVAIAAVVGFAGNEIVARTGSGTGRRIGSAALVADGLHARTDGFTSLAVLLGAGGVALGWQWADSVVGLLITVAILGVLRSAVAQVGARLMDAVDPRLVAQARATLRRRSRRHRGRVCGSGGSGIPCVPR